MHFTDSVDVESKLMRRRFVRNQDWEKQRIHFAKLEERRSKLRETLQKERRSRREAQVSEASPFFLYFSLHNGEKKIISINLQFEISWMIYTGQYLTCCNTI